MSIIARADLLGRDADDSDVAGSGSNRSVEADDALAPPTIPASAEPVAPVGSAEPSTRPRRPSSPALVVVVVTLTGLAVLGAWFLAFAFVFSGADQNRSQRQLFADFRGLLDASSAEAPPLGGVLPPGSPVAVLRSSAAGFDDLVVVEGTSAGDLLAGPGHLRTTPLPGQQGTAVVLGRSITAGGPFGSVPSLAKGDTVTAVTAQGEFTFQVDGIRRAGDPLPAQLPAGASRLTLVTTDGSGWRGVAAPGDVVFVDATLQGKAAPAPGGRVVAVPDNELPNSSDPGAWLFLVLWLQAAILVAVGFTWSWYRWGRWQTWVVGVPIAIAVLWGSSQMALRLLPNLV